MRTRPAYIPDDADTDADETVPLTPNSRIPLSPLSNPPSPHLRLLSRRSWWEGAAAGACLMTVLGIAVLIALVSVGRLPSTWREGGYFAAFPPSSGLGSTASSRPQSAPFAFSPESPTAPSSCPAPPACPSCPSPLSTAPDPSATSSIPSTPSLSSLVSLNHCRLQSVLRRLKEREPIRITAIGGSVTRHMGLDMGYLELLTQHLTRMYPPAPLDPRASPIASPSTPTTSSPSPLPFLRGGYHSRLPHNESLPLSHLHFNRGQSGTSSSFFSLCMSAFFPHAELSLMDLVLVEFGINDLSYAGRPQDVRAKFDGVDIDGVQRGAYFGMTEQFSSGGEVGQFDPSTNIERLIRYTLTRHVAEQWPGVASAEAADGPAIILVESCVMDGASAQAFHRPVAYHYGVLLVSVCEVLPHLWPSDAVARAYGAPLTSSMMFDQTHPNIAGHSIAAGMLMDKLLAIADGLGDRAVKAACAAWDAQVKAVMPATGKEDWPRAISVALPPPLFPHNEGQVEWHCTLGQFRQGAERTRADSTAPDQEEANFTLVDSGGWLYTDETGKGKWGWQTELVGATLALQLMQGTRHVVLAYLRTYQNIGSVEVWLSSAGWEGTKSRLDAWWERRMSTFELSTLPEALMPGKDAGVVSGEALVLHLQLLDVGKAAQHPPDPNVVEAANRFKLVSIFER